MVVNKCVYLHKDDANIVRYVGMGAYNRANDWGKRNKEWCKLFSTVRPIVEIVRKDLTLDEARTIEADLINTYKNTVCNVRALSKNINLDFNDLNCAFYTDDTSETGLRWRIPNGLYPNQPNYRGIGDIAGTKSVSKHGRGDYWMVKYKKVSMLAHRVIYIITHGSIDNKLVINHIDGNSLNNKVNNLEQVTQSYNIRTANRKTKSNSGLKNIREVIRNGKLVGYFVCRIVDGKSKRMSFSSSKNTPEKNKLLAISCLDSLNRGEYA